jgi:hypothetical protein
VEHCLNCGGALKIIAAIDDPPVIDKILSHLGLMRGPIVPTFLNLELVLMTDALINSIV